jgi:drug/metabolite transporter (DMT)-like permease
VSPHSPRPIGVATVAALAVAVVAISSSGPLIAYAAAPALAIAFWRNAIATGVLLPTATLTRRTELAGLFRATGRPALVSCLLAGVFLAAHFSTWVPSIKLTTVAMATALGATQPVWQGLIARGQGVRLGTAVWTGIGIAVLGAVAATGVDLGGSSRALYGDLLALLGGMAVAGYTALGERARATTSTTTYTTVCYGLCAILLLAVCAIGGVRITGFVGLTWLAILALTAGPQLLGHSMLNYALRRVSATTVAVLILLEVPGAGLVAWAWLGQAPRPAQLPGLALLVVGVAVVILFGRRSQAVRPTAEALAAQS